METASAPSCLCRVPLCSYFSRSAPDLRTQVLDAFHHKHGPLAAGSSGATTGRDLPLGKADASTDTQSTFPLVLLVPHGAAADSFPVAAHAYHELACVMDQRPIDTVLFVGNNHRRPGLALSDTIWETPLGKLEPHAELIAALVGTGQIDVVNTDHEREHSIENQLPLLQVIAEGMEELPRIVAVSVGYRAFSSAREATTLARTLRDVLCSSRGGETSKSCWAATTAIIGTTDYTHAGPGYRELPPGCPEPPGGWNSAAGQATLVEYARTRDKLVLDAIVDGDAAAIETSGRGTSMCGLWAAALTVEISSALGMKQRHLLKYAVSSEVCSHPSGNVTGFAAIAMAL